jgi:hypothetical protein
MEAEGYEPTMPDLQEQAATQSGSKSSAKVHPTNESDSPGAKMQVEIQADEPMENAPLLSPGSPGRGALGPNWVRGVVEEWMPEALVSFPTDFGLPDKASDKAAQGKSKATEAKSKATEAKFGPLDRSKWADPTEGVGLWQALASSLIAVLPAVEYDFEHTITVSSVESARQPPVCDYSHTDREHLYPAYNTLFLNG